MGKSAIIIGASSGIGKELAKVFSAKGFTVGLTARRTNLLEDLKKELPGKSFIKHMDLNDPDGSIKALKELIGEMGDVDIIVINSGVGHSNNMLEWEKEKPSIDVNVMGFTAMAVVATHYFIQRQKGQIVGISSVAAIKPFRLDPAYGASKAYISFYLRGLRNKFVHQGLRDVHVTDIKPGFVHTDLTKANEGMFWVASPQKAAKQIYDAIISKKKEAFVTKRWRFIAFMMRILPDLIYNRF
jgi:short-subunit dehydrogenase